MPDMPMPMGGSGRTAPPMGQPPMPGGPGAGPTPTPMATPQANEGLKKAAQVQVQMAVKLLQQQLPHFAMDSEENKAVLDALKALSRGFGKTEEKDRELFPAEIMQLLSGVNAPPPPGAMAGAGAPPPGMPGMPQPGAGAPPM